MKDVKLSPVFSKDRTIFAIIRNALFKSTDAGATWTRLNYGLADSRKRELVVSPEFAQDQTIFVATTSGVFRSEDGGSQWTSCSVGIHDVEITSLAISPGYGSDRTLLALSAEGALYRTSDAGRNWAPIRQIWAKIRTIGAAGQVLVAGGSSGEVFFSEDQGQTWVQRGQHPESWPITCLDLPEPFSVGQPFFVGTKKGFVRVVGQECLFEKPSASLLGRSIASLVSYQEGSRRILLATTEKEAVFRSKDGGRSWRKYPRGLRTHTQADSYFKPQFGRIVAQDSSMIVLGSFCGLFASNDGGRSWYKLETLLNHIIGLDLCPTGDSGLNLVISTYCGGAYSTEDGGLTWKVNNRGLSHFRLGMLAHSPGYANDETLFTASFNNFLKSTNGGYSWREISVYPEKWSPDWVLMRIKGKLFHSPTFRNSWLRALLSMVLKPDDGFVKPLVIAVSPNFGKDKTVMIGCHPYGIKKSTDGGETFSTVWRTLGQRVRALHFSPGYANDQTVYAALPYGVYRSLDRGVTWSRIGADHDLRDVALAVSPDFSNDRTLVAGSASGLFTSRDGGDTWREQQLGNQTSPSVAGIAISPDFANDRELLVQIRGGDLWLCGDQPEGFVATPARLSEQRLEFSSIAWKRDRGPLIAFSPSYAGDHTIFAASIHDLVKSSDRGRTWTRIPRKVRYEAEMSVTDWFLLPIQTKGRWRPDRLKGSGTLYSESPGSMICLWFVGDKVTWHGWQRPGGGSASVYIDGTLQGRVSQKGSETEEWTRSFSTTNQGSGFHTLTIRVEQQRIEVDSFDVSL